MTAATADRNPEPGTRNRAFAPRFPAAFPSHWQVVHYLADRVLVMYLGQVVEIGPVEALWQAAGHPYTRALLSTVPSLDPARRTERSPLAGDPPNPIDPPSGCRFRDRCPQAHAVCASQPPQALTLGPRHQAACHLNDPASGHPQARSPVSAATA